MSADDSADRRELTAILQRLEAAENAGDAETIIDRGTFSFAATTKSDGETTHARGKYLWLYSRDAAGSWKVARFIVSLDEGHEG